MPVGTNQKNKILGQKNNASEVTTVVLL